jgi:hypothetical protein
MCFIGAIGSLTFHALLLFSSASTHGSLVIVDAPLFFCIQILFGLKPIRSLFARRFPDASIRCAAIAPAEKMGACRMAESRRWSRRIH